MSKLRDKLLGFLKMTLDRRYDIIILTGVAFLLIFFVTVSTNQGIYSNLREGDTSTVDVQLSKNVSLIDEKKTKELWQRIRQETIPVFFHDLTIKENILKDIDLFFMEASRIATNDNMSNDEKYLTLRQLNSNISPKDLSILANTTSSKKVQEGIRSTLQSIYFKGLLKLSEMYTFHNNATIDIFEQEKIRPGSIRDFFTVEDLNLASMMTQKNLSLNPEETRMIQDYVRLYLKPDTFYDVGKTAMRMEEEIENTEPIMMHLKKGRIIIRKGDEITREKLKLVTEINRKIKGGMALNNMALFLAFFVIFFFFYHSMKMFDQRILKRRNYFYIFLTLSLFWFLFTHLLSQTTIPEMSGIPHTLLVPIALISLTFPLFFSIPFSLTSVILLTFVSGFLFQNDFIHYIPVFFTGLTGVTISGFSHKRRHNFWVVTTYLLISQIVFLFIMDFLIYLNLKQFLTTLLVGSLNILASLVAALGLVSILESIFNAATDFRLLEFSDLNKPIFKQMLLEAPGTYHHSILVANLAEAAAQEIGANSLLVKVAAYYHDIGKLAHPDFYIENSSYKNKLEEKDVKPTLYVSIVKQHLKEGIEMGHKIRLPEEVIEIMSQHHGKSLIKFFYFKALNMAKKTDAGLSKEDFKYDSENPHSREAVILLLADSVEAASRSLTSPSYQKIRDQVEEILNSKFSEGLLNDSEITLGEIRKIGDAFVKVFVGVFHSRVRYPDDEEIKNAEDIHKEE